MSASQPRDLIIGYPSSRRAEYSVEPWLNLSDAARLLKVASKTLRLAAEAGQIEAVHPLPDGPWLFARAALTTDAATSITERAAEPKIPRRIASRSTKSLLFNNIAEWVF